MKKGLALALSACMLAGCFTGCGDGGGTTGQNDAPLEGNTYLTGYPIVKETEKLKVLIVKGPTQQEYSQMSFNTYMQDLTNIEIEWEYMNWGDAEKVILDYQTDNMADISIVSSGTFTPAMVEQFAQQGKIAEVGDKIEKFAPNIKKLLDMHPENWELIKNDDGKIYGLPSINYGSGHTDYGNKMYIRKTWLDNLGLSVPTTMTEFYNVLRAFKNQDPNGNGQNDEIPFVYAPFELTFFANYGLVMSTKYKVAIDQNTGKYVYGPTSDNMREALRFMNRLYTENLMDHQVIEQIGKQEQVLKSGTVGCFISQADFTALGTELAKEYVMLNPLAVDGFATNCFYDTTGQLSLNHAVISSKCENVDAALRWIDYFFTPQGRKVVYGGALEDFVQFNDDGTWVEKRPFADSDWNSIPGGSMISGYDESFDEYDKTPEKDEADMNDYELANKELEEDCETVLAPFIPKYPLKLPRIDSDINKAIDDIGTQLDQQSNYMMMCFLVGTESIDSSWGTYVSEMKRLGEDEYVQTFQEKYDAVYGE